MTEAQQRLICIAAFEKYQNVGYAVWLVPTLHRNHWVDCDGSKAVH